MPKHPPSALARLTFSLLATLAILPGGAIASAAADEVARVPDFEIAGGIVVELLTAEESREAIVDPSDPFFSKLSLLEISLRLDRDVTAMPREEAIEEFRTFLRGEVADWKQSERDALSIALPRIAAACQEHCPKILPERWRFIRTTGRDELGAAYTRGDCVVLPDGIIQGLLRQNVEELAKLIVHETFHVWSRNHPKERDALYREIGFHPIAPVTLPDSIEKLRLTNPDGPGWEHAIKVRDPETDADCRAILLLTSRAPKFQKGYLGVIPVLSFHLYPLTDTEPPTLRLDAEGEPVRWRPDSTPGFLTTVGRNTGYIIHPDEILADNVAMLAYPSMKPPTPDLLERIGKHLGAKTPAPLGKGDEEKKGSPVPAGYDGGR